MAITLRPEQARQADWVWDAIQTRGRYALESPTGSGKTYTMLEVARRFLEANPLSNVLVTTGFNHLVFDMERASVEMGLEPLVLIGFGALNCPKEWEDLGLPEPFKPFDRNGSALCGHKHDFLDHRNVPEYEKTCPFCQTLADAVLVEVKNACGKVIITNHSMFLVEQGGKENLFSNCGLMMVDEAHTFESFYSNWVSLELNERDLRELDKAVQSLKPPMGMVIRMNIQSGASLPMVQLEALLQACPRRLKQKVRDFFTMSPAPNNWIERSPTSFKVTRFYRYFECWMPSHVVLWSATMDQYTLRMFGVPKFPYGHVYRSNVRVADYRNSSLLVIPRDDYESSLRSFLRHVGSKGETHVLCLCTTVVDMRKAMGLQGFEGYRMTINVTDMLNAKPDERVCLCGSRGLFQGVDIPNLDAVCMNRIPFSNYGEKDRKEQDYITDNGRNGIDAWKDIAVPRMQNALLQGSGRLWRKPDSKGTIGIFDSRCDKHKMVIKRMFETYRPGMVMTKLEQDGGILPW